MLSSILIPTDFSPASWKATQVGLELARLNSEAVLSILHVYPLSSRYSSQNDPTELPSQLTDLEKRMNQLVSELIDQSERINNLVLSGNVEKTMMSFIEENSFDLVIIGINSNGVDNYVGSHTMNLIKNSGTPVMIIPNNESKDAG